MPTLVAVRPRFAPKPQYFALIDDQVAAVGDHVIISTDRGSEIALVVSGPQESDETTGRGPFTAIERVATEDDLRVADELAEREQEAMRTYRELIKEHELDMKPIDVECVFDGGKIVFYFVAEERVDFRELVRDLASRLHARIDMRQVGVRDEARMVGGLGHCGETLCCVRFGGDFQPVSIRMAKEQDLPLNPQKISGLCGRLMCCLRYEYEAYKDFKGRAPRRNAIVETPDGLGKVIDFDTPRERITLQLEGGGRIEVPLTAMDCAKSEDGCGCPCRVRAELMPKPDAEHALLASATEPRAPRAQRSSRTTEKPEPAERAEQPQRAGRRRGRRGGGGGAGSGGRAEAPAGQKPRAEKPAPAEGQTPAEGTPPAGRRRRRRRPPQGGQAQG